MAMPNWKPVFTDDFPAGPDIDRVKWESPEYRADHNPAYIPRTGFRNRIDFVDPIGLVPCTPQNGADLRLSTFNPGAQPAESAFLGSCIYTKHKWGGQGETVKFEATVKGTAMPGGSVASVFAYALCTGRYVQNEVDFEFASNHWNGPNQQLLTNVFVCSSGAGSGPSVQNSPVNLQDWNTYSLIYTPSQSVEWRINGNSVRTETQRVPDWKTSEGMHLYMNFWAPAPGWDWAYNGGIQPTGAAGEQEWHYYVKRAAVYYAT
jgi:hypothetical protein